MSLGQRENNSIAWFVLAEFIRKGERERALTMYKLLMHNIDNPAFCIQVEADLLAFFKDQEAEKRYKLAATLYAKQQDHQSACFLYEQLLLLSPANNELQQLLFQSYNRLGIQERACFFLEGLTQQLYKQGEDQLADLLIHNAKELLDYLASTKSSAKNSFTQSHHEPLNDLPLIVQLNTISEQHELP